MRVFKTNGQRQIDISTTVTDTEGEEHVAVFAVFVFHDHCHSCTGRSLGARNALYRLDNPAEKYVTPFDSDMCTED
jgi:hypothetical protein